MANVWLGCPATGPSAEMFHAALGFHCRAAAGTSFRWGTRPAAAALVLSIHKQNLLLMGSTDEI